MICNIAFNFIGFKRLSCGSEICTVPNMKYFGLEHQNHKKFLHQYKFTNTKLNKSATSGHVLQISNCPVHTGAQYYF